MTEARPEVRIPTPAAVLAVLGVLGVFVALAAIEPTIAILIVIFGFVFGDDLLRYVTVAAGEDESTVDDPPAVTNGDPENALERLRVRYADGELSDAEFERRLEVLLETETVADVERYLEGAEPQTAGGDTQRERERSLE